MAFSSVATIGTGNSTVNDTSLLLTTTAACEVGSLVALIIALNNTQTTDGVTDEISSISDTNGNTWQRFTGAEYCNGQGGVDVGATVSVWYSIITTAMAVAAVITITLANSKARKCVSGWEFTLDAGSTVAIAGTLQTLANDAVDPGAMALSGLPSKEYLFFRGTASETGDNTAVTVTTNYTLITRAEADTGVGAANEQMSAFGEFRILTGTGSTSNPTYVSADHASVFFALEEVFAAADIPKSHVFLQAVHRAASY